ncbi:hypothetical protein [Streptomyces nanshensis]|nr:hypothetical protein [Streptomyces nanshensis]
MRCMGVIQYGGDGDRQSGDGQVGGPYSSPGDAGNPMPQEPDDSEED